MYKYFIMYKISIENYKLVILTALIVLVLIEYIMWALLFFQKLLLNN